MSKSPRRCHSQPTTLPTADEDELLEVLIPNDFEVFEALPSDSQFAMDDEPIKLAKGRTRIRHPKTGTCRTFINFIKGCLGTGILAMPHTFKIGGSLFGGVGIIFIGLLSTYCCHLLLRAYRLLSNNGATMSYAEVAESAFQRAGGRWARYSSKLRLFVNFLLVISQLGFCAVYIKFCARMAKEVFEGDGKYHCDIVWYEAIVTAILIPYCFIKTLKSLAIYTLVANVLTVTSLVIMMQYILRHLSSADEVVLFPSSFGSVSLFFGSAMFTFEAIALVLPIENSMKERHKFHGCAGVLTVSMLFIIFLYVLVGTFGYMAFGENAQMVLSNLPHHSAIYSMARLMYACSVFISFNLQLYVVVHILYPPLSIWLESPYFLNAGELILRTVLVTITYLLAVFIPCLELMMSLFGAFASSWLALILPPIIEMAACGSQKSLGLFILCKRLSICLFGLFGCVVGTFTAFRSIIYATSNPELCSKAEAI